MHSASFVAATEMSATLAARSAVDMSFSQSASADVTYSFMHQRTAGGTLATQLD